MNAFEREQVDKICEAWYRYSDGIWINEIAGESRNMIAEKGIHGSNFKPDLIGPKVDKCNRHPDLEFMLYACEVFEELEVQQRWLLIAKIKNRALHKRDKSFYKYKTTQELARELGLTHDAYRSQLKRNREKVLEIDKRNRLYAYKTLLNSGQGP